MPKRVQYRQRVDTTRAGRVPVLRACRKPACHHKWRCYEDKYEYSSYEEAMCLFHFEIRLKWFSL